MIQSPSRLLPGVTEARNHVRSQFWAIMCGVYTLVLVCATHWPGDDLPPEPGWLDKALHFFAYAVLAFLFFSGFKGASQGPRVFAGIGLAIMLIFGGLDELTQWPIPGRFPEVLDWVADALGTALGASVYLLTQGRSPSTCTSSSVSAGGSSQSPVP